MKPPFTTLALLLTGLAGPFWAMQDDSTASFEPSQMVMTNESIQRLLDVPLVVERSITKRLATLAEPSWQRIVRGWETSRQLATQVDWRFHAVREHEANPEVVGFSASAARSLKNSIQRRVSDTAHFVVLAMRESSSSTELVSQIQYQRGIWLAGRESRDDATVAEQDMLPDVRMSPADEWVACRRCLEAIQPHWRDTVKMLEEELHRTWHVRTSDFEVPTSWRRLATDLAAIQLREPLPPRQPSLAREVEQHLDVAANVPAADGELASRSAYDQRRLVLGFALLLDEFADRLHVVSDELIDMAYKLPDGNHAETATHTARRSETH